MDCSTILPCPALAYPKLHCNLLPSYHILPRPTLDSSSYTGFFSHPTLSYPITLPITFYTGFFSHPNLSYNSIHPTTSYTGLFIHPTPSYSNLLRPTLDCSAILCYCTLSYILLPFTLDCSSILPFAQWIVQGCILLPSYTGFYPVLPYPTTSNHTLPCHTSLPQHSPTSSYPI